MNRTEKSEFVQTMNTRLQDTRALFLADFTGLSVPQNNRLRAALTEADVELKVVKNRLFKLATEGTDFAGVLDEMLVGPNAILIVDDLVGAAKALKDFLKAEAVPFKVKGGALGAKALSADEIDQLAAMPSRDQLLGQFVGLLNAPLRDFAALLQAPLRDFVGVLSALEQQKNG